MIAEEILRKDLQEVCDWLFQQYKDSQSEEENMTMTEMRKKMPPCPICGRKAYLDHFIVDGFDFGYDAGCPSFCLNDGVHGISEPYHPDRPHINHFSAKGAFDGWIAYCERMKKVEG